jgi:hypothetical protein
MLSCVGLWRAANCRRTHSYIAWQASDKPRKGEGKRYFDQRNIVWSPVYDKVFGFKGPVSGVTIIFVRVFTVYNTKSQLFNI